MSDTDYDDKDDAARDEKADVRYWLSQISDAKQAVKEHHKSAKDAQDEYLGQNDLRKTKGSKRFPIFWSSIQTLQPALYSSTPVTIAERRLKAEDAIGRTGTIIVERLAEFLIDSCPFDRTMAMVRDDFILANKAAPRVMLEVEESTQLVTDPLTGMMQEVPVQIPKVYPQPLSILDVLHNKKARYWEEIDWLGFKLCPDRREVQDEFGPEIASKIAYNKATIETLKGVDADDIEVWEIWDKRSKRVYWISECYPDGFLKVVDDPYELDGFFPIPPFVLSCTPYDSMFPIPDYCQLEPLIQDVHQAWKRLSKLLRSTRIRGAYNANIAELKRLENSEEAEYIPISDWQNLINQGGLQAAVQHFPTAELFGALNTLIQCIQVLLQFFFEQWGIPDIIRGTSDPVETARAQKIKERYASLRFSARQRQFQEQVRRVIEMMVDLALAKYSDQYIAEICGLEFMDVEDQQRFGSALQMLRNDRTRNIRVNIETDSTILINEEAQAQKTAEITQTIMSGLSQFAQFQQLPPALTAMVGKVIVYSVRGLRDAKSLEDEIQSAINEALQPPPPPEGPPPPDIEQLKLQEDQRQHTVDSQLKQYELEIKQMGLSVQQQRDEAKAAMEAQIRLNEVAIQQQSEATKATIEAAKVEIERLKAESAARIDQARLAFDEQTARMVQMIEMAKLQQDAMQERLDAANRQNENYERMIEEIRLAQSRPKVREAEVVRDPLTGLMQQVRVREVDGAQ